MRTLSDGLIHSDVAKLNVNNLSGMKLLEGNYDCYLQSQRPIRYLTSFPGGTSHTTMCVLISKNYPPRKKSHYHECKRKMSSTAYSITWRTLKEHFRFLRFLSLGAYISWFEYLPHIYTQQKHATLFFLLPCFTGRSKSHDLPYSR